MNRTQGCKKVIGAEDVVLVIITARAKAYEEIDFLKLGKQNVNFNIFIEKFRTQLSNHSKSFHIL